MLAYRSLLCEYNNNSKYIVEKIHKQLILQDSEADSLLKL